MRLLWFELKKVFSNKLFWGILLFSICLNVFTLYETNKPDALSASFAETKAFYAEIRGMTNVQKVEYLSEQDDILQTIFLKEKIESPDMSALGKASLNGQYKQAYEKYKEVLDQTIDYDAAHRRDALIRKAASELKTVSGYDDYLDSVEKNAKTLLSSSIFGGSLSGFSRANIEKTAKDFKNMRGIEIEYDVNDGIVMLVNSKITDVCVLLILIALGLSLIGDEKEKRLFGLLRSMANGTVKTIAAKIAGLFWCALFANAVLSASTAGFAAYTYGFGDLARAVQSVPDMTTSFLRVNLYEFFALFFSVKTLGIFIIGVTVIFLTLLAKRPITMLLAALLIGGANLALTFIPATAKFNHFKYINLYSLINPYPVLHSYLNLNFFGKPINAMSVFAVFTVLLFFVLVSAATVYYLKKKPLENRENTGRKTLFAYRTHGSCRYFEWKKLLSLNKAALIVVLFVLFQGYAVTRQTNRMSSEDYYYQYYMNMLAGPLTTEKEKFLLREQEKIDDAQQSLDELNRQKTNHEISTQEFVLAQEPYSEILSSAQSFSIIYQKYVYIKDNPGAEFFFDRGYERLFGITEPDFSLDNYILLLGVFALCLCGLFSVEYKNEIYRVLNATKFGIRKTRKEKLRIAVLTALIIFVFAYLPELIYIGRFYGFPNAGSPLISISALSYLGNMPIWGYMAILYMIRFAVLLLLVPIISAFSLFNKNSIFAALSFIIVFVLPLILYKLGFAFMKNYSLIPLFFGTPLVRAFDGWSAAASAILLSLFSCACLGFTCRFGKASDHLKISS